MPVPYKDQINHPNWQRKRLEIFERDNFACTICGNTEQQLEVHHLYYLPDYLIWEYDDDCYKTLCQKHHIEIHKDISKLSGLIAYKILEGKIDITDFIKYLKSA